MSRAAMSRGQELRLLALLALMLFLAPFATSAYLPVMPQMALDLDASVAQTQATVAAFLGGAAVGPLIAGPLSDALGRRSVINAGIGLFALGSVACALSTTVELLIGMRFLQSFGGTAAVIAGRALLADVYHGDRLAQRMSMLMMVVAAGPIVAPILGGWAGVRFGWPAIFWGLAGASALIALVGQIYLKETLPPQNRLAFGLKQSVRAYGPLMRDRCLMAYACAGFAMMAVQIAFISAVPFLFKQLFDMAPDAFAFYFAGCACVAVLANFANIRCVGWFGFRRVLVWQAIGLIVQSALVLTLAGTTDAIGAWAVWGAGFFVIAFAHVVITNAVTGALEVQRDQLGSVSALFGTLRFGGGMLGSLVIAWCGGGSDLMVFAGCLFGFSALAGGASVVAIVWDARKETV